MAASMTWWQRQRWYLARLWAALGAAELIAVALLALWAGLQWQVLAPLSAMAVEAQQQEEVVRLRVEAARRLPAALQAGTDPRADFLAFLPAEAVRESQLLSLHALAQDQSLLVQGVKYRVEPLATLPGSRLSLHLQLQGPYAAQRRFLHEALARLPNLAVTRLALEGGSGGDGVMTTQLDASLFYRAGGER